MTSDRGRAERCPKTAVGARGVTLRCVWANQHEGVCTFHATPVASTGHRTWAEVKAEMDAAPSSPGSAEQSKKVTPERVAKDIGVWLGSIKLDDISKQELFTYIVRARAQLQESEATIQRYEDLLRDMAQRPFRDGWWYAAEAEAALAQPKEKS